MTSRLHKLYLYLYLKNRKVQTSVVLDIPLDFPVFFHHNLHILIISTAEPLPTRDCKVLCNIYYFTNILTPMQHKSAYPSSPRRLQPSPHTLPQLASDLTLKQVCPLKLAFTQWLKSLPMEQRLSALKIHAPGLPHAIRTTLRPHNTPATHRNGENVNLKLDILHSQEHTAHTHKIFKTIQDHLLFASDGPHFLDHLCFDQPLLQCPEQLFDLLTTNVTHSSARLVEEALASKRNSDKMVELMSGKEAMDTMVDQLLNFMRESVLINFRNSVIDYDFVPRRLEEEKSRKRQFSNYWRGLTQGQKLILLLLESKHIKQLAQKLFKKGIDLSYEQLQNEVKELLALQNNQFCSRIFKCRLKKALQPTLDYYQLVYIAWKKNVEKQKRKKQIKQHRSERDYSSHKTSKTKKKEKTRKSISVQSNQTNQTQHQRNLLEKTIYGPENSFQQFQEKIKPEQSTQIINQHYYQQMAQSKIQSSETLQSVNIDTDRSYKVKGKQRNREMLQGDSQRQSKIIKKIQQTHKNPQQYIQNDQYQRPKKQTSICSWSTQLSAQSSIQDPSPPAPTLPLSTIKQSSLSKLAEQVEQLSDRISEQANQYHQRRIIAFQRIQFLLQYYSIPIKLFGSCANGIAVKNSDIDIAIDKSILQWMQFIPQSQKVRAALQHLQQLFHNYPCFRQIKLIKTAAIPVMKLTLDTSIPFLQPEFGQPYYTLNRNHNAGPIQADITIETFNQENQSSHLGIRTTSTINQWLSDIPTLHTIVIVMKEFFAINKLHLAYEGGLNTFAMIVMMVAYITHMRLEKQQNSAIVLQKILYFYTEEFNQKQNGIDLLNSNRTGIFYRKSNGPQSPSKLMKADLEMRDPICQSKNMTRNCYLYPEIKKMFKNMLTQCFQRAQHDLQQLIESTEPKPNSNSLEELQRDAFAKRNLFCEMHQNMQHI